MSKNNEYASSSEVVANAGPGRRVITMIETLASDRHRTTRARDRGDTMIEIARTITAQGGQARVEAEEADGTKFSLTVAAPLPALEVPGSAKVAFSEVLAPPVELQEGDRAE